ncbi:hypothetical protein HG535_0H03950 [Zygotorulaspora mrakii]|uniref:Uncharacterized protein n=1 Tax=Zygotorulaspora mrakii TaxID=42260 RepID=A0A7H9B8H6_ZYGMR|nr:uncharacterized protein HG535_0H03950 [Zygotorulaspora mrakii]QLG75068.1 hypothetical protein HG535_0H03950 [Zygotorulaspora mrakii]
MKFISCIPIGGPAINSEEDELVLCQCEIQEIPQSKENVNSTCVSEITISEGTDIYRRMNVRMCDMRVFESSKECVWYEFLKFLTGHKIQLPLLNDTIHFSSWVCYTSKGGNWNIVMELESAGITKKLAELQLDAIHSGEVDLFQFTNVLFHESCQLNDRVHHLESKVAGSNNRIKMLQEEQTERSSMLQKRDDRTRAVVVALLNEKKSKIKELYDKIDRLKSNPMEELPSERISDSDIINKHVNDPVSHLTSPGKRRKRTPSDQDSGREQVKKRIIPKVEQSSDDFEDFQFFGISKHPEMLSRNGSPQKSTNIKHGSRATETDTLPNSSQEIPPYLQHASASAPNTQTASVVKSESNVQIIPQSSSSSNESDTETEAQNKTDTHKDKFNTQTDVADRPSDTEQNTEGETDQTTDLDTE